MKLRKRINEDTPDTAQTSPYGLAILLELNRSGRHIYDGSVGPVEKAKRRAKNKAARKARRVTR